MRENRKNLDFCKPRVCSANLGFLDGPYVFIVFGCSRYIYIYDKTGHLQVIYRCFEITCWLSTSRTTLKPRLPRPPEVCGSLGPRTACRPKSWLDGLVASNLKQIAKQSSNPVQGSRLSVSIVWLPTLTSRSLHPDWWPKRGTCQVQEHAAGFLCMSLGWGAGG